MVFYRLGAGLMTGFAITTLAPNRYYFFIRESIYAPFRRFYNEKANVDSSSTLGFGHYFDLWSGLFMGYVFLLYSIPAYYILDIKDSENLKERIENKIKSDVK